MTSFRLLRKRRVAVVTVVIASSALAAHVDIAAAQTPTTAACTSARELLLKNNGGSRTDLVVASNTIIRCGDMAPTTIMALLGAATPNSFRDSLAQRAAWSLADGRLLDSVAHMSRNPQRSVARRTFALGLLMRYVDPSAGLNPAGATQMLKPVIVNVFDDDPIVGNVPIDDIRRTVALNHIAAVGTDDPDPTLRTLASLVKRKLDFRLANRRR
jgi:hypothetical protein